MEIKDYGYWVELIFIEASVWGKSPSKEMTEGDLVRGFLYVHDVLFLFYKLLWNNIRNIWHNIGETDNGIV